jgi:hypothetical protein
MERLLSAAAERALKVQEVRSGDICLLWLLSPASMPQKYRWLRDVVAPLAPFPFTMDLISFRFCRISLPAVCTDTQRSTPWHCTGAAEVPTFVAVHSTVGGFIGGNLHGGIQEGKKRMTHTSYRDIRRYAGLPQNALTC